VIGEIWQQRETLRIVPRAPVRDFNAVTTPGDLRRATIAGQPEYDAQGHAQPTWGRGTGQGSSVSIAYSPRTGIDDTHLYFMSRHWEVFWMVHAGLVPLAPGNDRVEILVHEMVHALAMLTGSITGRRYVAGRWDNEDEFRAILVTNIYSSERGRPLRMTHRGGQLMANPGTVGGVQNLAQLLTRFATEMPALTARLRGIETPFNPFRNSFQPTDAMQ
jgi:hypothetical protein